jgi:hypothetical protein
MSIDKKLDLLKRIKAVEAPPFLFTRIYQQINNPGTAEAPIKWKWAFALTSIFLLALNISILFTSSTVATKKNAGIANIVNTMSLSAQNDLYNE